MYVSLEPCCHQGRTPPCTDAIREAGIARVVVASDDPSEHASGRGLGILRDEGIEVVVADGELGGSGPAPEPAVSQARPHRPAVGAVQVGDVAGRQGRDPQRRLEVDLERRQPRARPRVAGASRTRSPSGSARRSPMTRCSRPGSTGWTATRQPRRVVFDSLARLPLALEAGRRRAHDPADRRRLASRPAFGHRRSREPRRRGDRAPPARTSRHAFARRSTSSAPTGVASILLEGGPKLAGVFLDAGEIDEIRLFIAPIVIGGRSARDPLESEGVESIADAVQVADAER